MATAFARCLQHIATRGAVTSIAAFAVVVGSSSGHTSMAVLSGICWQQRCALSTEHLKVAKEATKWVTPRKEEE